MRNVIRGRGIVEPGEIERERNIALAAEPDGVAHDGLSVNERVVLPMNHWFFWPFKFIFALGIESSAHRLMESCQWREAAETYERLIQWSPNQATFHTEKGLAHMMLNEWEPAEDGLRKAIRIDSRTLRAYDLLGVLLANQGRTDEARDVWERSIEAARNLAIQRPLLYGRFAESRIREARERLDALDAPDFAGFPVDPGYAEYPSDDE